MTKESLDSEIKQLLPTKLARNHLKDPSNQS